MMGILEIKEYVKENEVVYQCIDELMEISNKQNNFKITHNLEKASNISSLDKASLIENGFGDLVNWSTENDDLYLIDDQLLICIPK